MNKLIKKQGWKVFDLTENEYVLARALLEKQSQMEIFKYGRSQLFLSPVNMEYQTIIL
jgi:hypothetical protein